MRRVGRGQPERIAPTFRPPRELWRLWNDLRRGLSQQRSQLGVQHELVIQARAMRLAREAILDALRGLQSCGHCAAGHPPPHGTWSGGFCCGGSAEALFTADELAALSLSGTRPHHLVPRPYAAGCLFRGARGCGLSPRHRPNLCVRFLCQDLQRELARRGDLTRVERLCARLEGDFGAFARRCAEVRERDWSEALDRDE